MAKRRTRKDKETAHHSYTVSWKPSASLEPVKKQKNMKTESAQLASQSVNNATVVAFNLDLASIQKDLLKSLFISAFIIAFEVVIYFFWK